MSDFYKKFLLEDARRAGTGSGRQIFLGAFGKHPGWDDHVEDLGLESESLIIAKTLLYVEGIGSQIDKGDWEKLDPQQQIPAFKHVFVWQRAGQYLIGRLWSSSDGKGRTRYPMIVCAHCSGVSLSWALEQVLPRLEKIEQECLLTKSAADVRFILNSARNALRISVNDVGTEIEPAPAPVTPQELAAFAAHPSLGPQQEGWFRLLYQMQSQVAAFLPGKFSLKGDAAGIRPQQLRLPPCGSSMFQTILLWTRFFQTQLDAAVPFLLTLPIEEPWLDVTLGEPTPHEFFCLRASPKAVPLANEVPYNLDADFRQRAAAILANFQSGQSLSKTSLTPSALAPASSGLASTKQKLLKWFGGGAALLVALIGLAVFLSRPKKENAPVAKADPPPAGPRVIGPPLTPPPTGTTPAGLIEAQARERTRAAAEAEAREKVRLAGEAEVKRLAEEKRLKDEKAKIETAARVAEDREKIRLAAQAVTRPAVDPGAKSAPAGESARPASGEETSEKPLLVANAKPAPAKETSAPPQPAGRSSGSTMTNSIGMVLARMPGNYWVGILEVTQAQYRQIMGANPSKTGSRNDPRLPVESVSWNDAMRFCQELTAKEKAAGTLAAGETYALPTQKQWNEFLGDAKFEEAVTSDAGRRDAPAPAGSAGAPNNFGLFDVFGNVWEWSADESPAHDKLCLGGAYNSLKSYALKKTLAANTQASNVGFRCVITPSP